MNFYNKNKKNVDELLNQFEKVNYFNALELVFMPNKVPNANIFKQQIYEVITKMRSLIGGPHLHEGETFKMLMLQVKRILSLNGIQNQMMFLGLIAAREYIIHFNFNVDKIEIDLDDKLNSPQCYDNEFWFRKFLQAYYRNGLFDVFAQKKASVDDIARLNLSIEDELNTWI